MSSGRPGRVRGIDGEDKSPAIPTTNTVRSRANTAIHPMPTPSRLSRVFCVHRLMRRTATVTATSGRLRRVPNMYGEFLPCGRRGQAWGS
jgi:hypothetical protein